MEFEQYSKSSGSQGLEKKKQEGTRSQPLDLLTTMLLKFIMLKKEKEEARCSNTLHKLNRLTHLYNKSRTELDAHILLLSEVTIRPPASYSS